MSSKYSKMSSEEKKDWWALDDYVRHNVMGYENEGLNKQMTLRLKGMRYGQVLANNKQHKRANYSFKTILNTFKACSATIQHVVRTKTFKSDMDKFNYIMAIIDRRIAEISQRERYARQAKEEAEQKAIEMCQTESVAKYKPKKRKQDDLFADLW